MSNKQTNKLISDRGIKYALVYNMLLDLLEVLDTAFTDCRSARQLLRGNTLETLHRKVK